jgi:hypothetical protein
MSRLVCLVSAPMRALWRFSWMTSEIAGQQNHRAPPAATMSTKLIQPMSAPLVVVGHTVLDVRDQPGVVEQQSSDRGFQVRVLGQHLLPLQVALAHRLHAELRHRVEGRDLCDREITVCDHLRGSAVAVLLQATTSDDVLRRHDPVDSFGHVLLLPVVDSAKDEIR